MPNKQVIPVNFAVQYTGSNSAELITYALTYWGFGSVTACTVKSESGGVLVLNVESNGGPANYGSAGTVTVHTGDWLTPSFWRSSSVYDPTAQGWVVVPNSDIAKWLYVVP